MGSIQIQTSADDPPTVIERDPGASQSFRLFHVSTGGDLSLEGLTVQKGGSTFSPFPGSAIFNLGVTSLQNSIITENSGEAGAIFNSGALNVFRSIITDNCRVIMVEE